MILVEFKKERHDENLRILHRLKEDVCDLIDAMKHEAHERRHDDYDYDERGRGRGGRMNRRYREEIDDRYNY